MDINPVGQLTTHSQSFSKRACPDPLHLNQYLATLQSPPYPISGHDHLYHLRHHYPTYPNPDHTPHYHPDHFDHQVHPCQIQTHTLYNSHHPHDRNQPQNSYEFWRSIEDKIGELLTSQHTLRDCLQSNNEVARVVQDNQQENRASIRMMIMQASQLAEVLNEMKGNLRKRLLVEHAPEPVEVDNIILETKTLCEERLPVRIIEDQGEGLEEKTESSDERLEKEEIGVL